MAIQSALSVALSLFRIGGGDAMRCDHRTGDGTSCTEWGLFGWTAPPEHERPKRPLRACKRHVAWAEARWRSKYHRTPGSPSAARQPDPQGAIHPPTSDPQQA